MNQAEQERDAVAQHDLTGPGIGLMPIHVGDRRAHNGQRDQDIDDRRIRGDELQRAEDEGDAVPDGEGRDDDQDLTPLNQTIRRAQGGDEQEVVVRVDVNDVLPPRDEK